MKGPQIRLGVRLARRELRRRPARAALVVLMVLIPTGAMAAVTTIFRTSEWTAADQQRAEFGQADATAIRVLADGSRGLGVVTDDELDDLRARLGPGAVALVERSMYDRVRHGDRRTYIQVDDLAVGDPMVVGRFGRLTGRLPAVPGETVLTRRLARELGLGIGGRLTPDRLGRPLVVVGLVTAMESNTNVAFVPGPLPASDSVSTSVWIDHAGPPRQVRGWQVTAVAERTLGKTKTDGVFWTYVGGGIGLLVLGTVVTAAFAIGARRQLRSVGLLASSGAAPRTIAWFLVAQGTVAGAVGSFLGIAGGLLATRLMPPRLLEGFANRPVDGPVTRVADLVPILIIGTGAAMVAAWLPARSAARVPTLQALAGRRPLPTVPRRLPLLGACSVGFGCALFAMAVSGARGARSSSLWALIAVGGAVAVLVGTLTVAPWAVAGLERVCTRWSRSWRLAGRSLARSRVRSSAVVGAICAVAATVVGGSTLYESLVVDRGSRCCGYDLPNLRADQVLLRSRTVTWVDLAVAPDVVPEPVPASVLARLDRIVPGSRRIELAKAVTAAGQRASVLQPDPTRGGPFVPFDQFGPAIATPGLLDLFGVPARLRRALDRGEAISVGGPALKGSRIQLLVGGGELPNPMGPAGVPATVPAVPATFPNGGPATVPATFPGGTPAADPNAVPAVPATFPGGAPAGAPAADPAVPATFPTSGPVLGPPQATGPAPRPVAVRLGGSFDSPAASYLLPTILLGAPLADRLGLVAKPSGQVLVVLPAPATARQQRALSVLGQDLAWEAGSLGARGPNRSFELGLDTPYQDGSAAEPLVRAGILAVSLVLILAVVAVGLALAARDSEDERLVLGAVGAPPRVLRQVGTRRATLLVLTAAVIAVPAGLLPASAIVAAANRSAGLRLDPWSLAFVVVGVPLAVALATAASGRLRDGLRPDRPEVLALAE